MQGTQTHLEFIPSAPQISFFAAYSERVWPAKTCLIGGFVFLILRIWTIALEASTPFTRLPGSRPRGAMFLLRLCQHGHGLRHLACGGRATALYRGYGGTAMVTLGLALGMLMAMVKAKRLVQS